MEQNQYNSHQPLTGDRGQPLVQQDQPPYYPTALPVETTGQYPVEPPQYQTSQPMGGPTYQGIPQPQYFQAQGYPPHQFGNGGVAPKVTPAMFRGVLTSVFCECPSCGQVTHTRVEEENSPLQWILCLIICVVGLWCCCCIPFCIDNLKAGKHYCSSCGSCIGHIQG
ncbi:unnamed protein product [Moneuplotes crassus]|uniref:LITAF domain-containing protein n=1 Tax=Euplotes crassus TaxID=5936 RepID=A0AAD2D176_EUPCR|nr:unnamed protein product [Moneuplotes crassus]